MPNRVDSYGITRGNQIVRQVYVNSETIDYLWTTVTAMKLCGGATPPVDLAIART